MGKGVCELTDSMRGWQKLADFVVYAEKLGVSVTLTVSGVCLRYSGNLQDSGKRHTMDCFIDWQRVVLASLGDPTDLFRYELAMLLQEWQLAINNPEGSDAPTT